MMMSNPHPGQTVQSLSPPNKHLKAARNGPMIMGRNNNSQLGNYMTHNEKMLLAHQKQLLIQQ